MTYLLYTASFVTLEEVKNYKSMQSFKMFVSGGVREVEWKIYGSYVVFGAKVDHSYSTTKKPLRVWVIVHSDGPVEVGHCTCMAGLGETCSHVGALLHWIETAVRCSDDTACTSKENEWIGRSRGGSSLPHLTLREIFTTSQATEVTAIRPPNSDEQKRAFSALSQMKKKPVILSLAPGMSDPFVTSDASLPPDFSAF